MKENNLSTNSIQSHTKQGTYNYVETRKTLISQQNSGSSDGFVWLLYSNLWESASSNTLIGRKWVLSVTSLIQDPICHSEKGLVTFGSYLIIIMTHTGILCVDEGPWTTH